MFKNLKLVAVTKNRSISEILKMLEQTGANRIGENRLKEAEEKFPELFANIQNQYENQHKSQTPRPSKTPSTRSLTNKQTFPEKTLETHFIGKLQSRKIAKIVELFDVIQSVENLEQAQKISAAAQAANKTMKVFLQVNISKLEQRSGASIEETPKLIIEIQKLENVQLLGLMGMASPDLEATRKEFKILKSLQGDLAECSMGMSGDWQIALEEGSTMLRLGRILFEENLPPLPPFE